MKRILEHPVWFVASQLGCYALVFSWIVFWHRLRARGYRGTRIAPLIAASLLGGGLLAAALVWVLDHFPSLPHPGNRDGWNYLELGAFCAFAAVLMLLLLWVLPERGPRDIRGGFRKGWLYLARTFSTVTVLLTGFTLFLLVLAIRSPRDGGPVGGFLLSAFVTWQYFRMSRIYVERARASRAADAVARSDPRPPVLYLRSFKEEKRRFDYLEPGPRAANPWLPTGGYLSLDHYLTATVERLVGPFVALGNPDDVFAPAGAARAYADSQSWREEFASLATRCAAILVVPADAGGLTWELEQLRAAGESAKLHILFGRCVYERVEDTRRNRILYIGAVPRPFDWESFRRALTAMGYTPPDSPPEPGTVVSFDARGRIARITPGCGTPEDYVRAIQPRSAAPRD